MSKVYEIAFQMGGQITASFAKSMRGAESALGDLQKQINHLNKSQDNIEDFRKLQKSVGGLSRELKEAQEKAQRLGSELAATEKPTKAQQKEFKKARYEAAQLKEKYAQQRGELQQLRTKMGAAGKSTQDFIRDQQELAKSAEKARKAQAGLQKTMAKQQANLDKRDNLRGQLFDAAGMAVGLAAPIRAAMQEEMSQFRLGTVIDDPKNMTLSQQQAREIAKTGLATLQEAYDSQYALFSAGFNSAAARAGSEVALGVAKATGGQAEQVTEIIATAYNNLGNQLDGTAQEKLQEIGDVLTKTQLKFQIRDFGQLGESFKQASASLAGFNVNMAQGATALGLLNTAGLQGGTAGTAINAVLRNLTKASREYGFEVQRTANGQLDLVGTVKELNESLAGMGDLEKTDSLQKIFGDEGMKGIIPLIQKVNELDAAVKAVGEDSAGIVDQKVNQYLATSTAQWDAMTQQLRIAGSAIGTALLPALNGIMSSLGPALTGLVDFTQQFPTLTKFVVGGVAALMALKVATIAGGFAWTYIYGAGLKVVKMLKVMRVGWLLATGAQVANNSTSKASIVVSKGLAAAQWLVNAAVGAGKWAWAMAQMIAYKGAAIAMSAATKIMTAGQWLFNAALAANPIGLVITAIGALVAAGIWMWQNWDQVTSMFSNAWDYMSNLFVNFKPIQWIKSAFKPVTDFFSNFSLFGESKGIIDTIKTGFKYLSPVSWVTSSFTAALNWLNQFSLFRSGKKILQTLGQGILSAANSVIGSVKSVFSKVREYLPFSDAKVGPFSELTKSGSAIMSTLANGINKSPDMQQAINKKFADSNQFGMDILSKIGDTASAIFNAPIKTIRAAIDMANSKPDSDGKDTTGSLARLMSSANGESSKVSGDTVQLTVRQTITVQGGNGSANVEQQARDGARQGVEGLSGQLEELMKRKRRLSYG